MNDPDNPGAHPRRNAAWRLLLPAILLPLWFAMGYAGIELAWSLHLAWHPQDGGHALAYWHSGIDGPRFLMLIPPMVGALPLAMLIANVLVTRLPSARHAMLATASADALAHYAASQRALLKFAVTLALASATAAILGAWLG